MKYVKIREVKNPNRGSDLAAGIDFFIPEFNEKFIEDLSNKNGIIYLYKNMIKIEAHSRVLIPAGIKVYLDDNRMLVAKNKSGVATKKGLIFGAQLIDPDYEGEIHISLINTSNEDVFIESGDKIIQFVEMEFFKDIEEITDLSFQELHSIRNTNRGTGGFGSTGNK